MSLTKKVLLAVALGGLAAGLAFGATVLAGNDLRVMFAAGCIALCAAGWFVKRKTLSLTLVIVTAVPLIATYFAAIAPQLPSLWGMPVLWLVSALIGAALTAPVLIRVAALAVIPVAGWYAWQGIPRAITSALTQYVNVAAPDFAFETVDGARVTKASLAGKVVVLDFFNTWCVPCRVELPEMARVRDALANDPRVVFYIVADESGGDTPETVRSFAGSTGHHFQFGIDRGGKAHDAFGLRGVPALVVIDAQGQIRLRRRGYNAAETEFASMLRDYVRSIAAGGTDQTRRATRRLQASATIAERTIAMTP